MTQTSFGYNDWLTPLDVSKNYNQIMQGHYYKWLMKLSLSLFKWNNLPDTVSERFLELTLQTYGRVLFIKPDGLEHIVVKATESNLNQYGDGRLYNVATPIPITPTQYNDQTAVMIYNDDFKSGMLEPLSIYSHILAENKKIMKVNKAQLMTPTVLGIDERMRKSFVNFMTQVQDGAINIITGKSLDLENITTLDLKPTYYIDKLEEHNLKTWNEALTFIGIQNNNNPKKERNITSEIDSNNMQTDLSADIRLKQRELACEQINSMFGLNVSVELRRELTLPDLNEVEGGVSDADQTKQGD